MPAACGSTQSCRREQPFRANTPSGLPKRRLQLGRAGDSPMSTRGVQRRRRAVKYYLRTDDPLELLVYDALRSLAAAPGANLARVSWKLSILGLLAAHGVDPRPLANRLGLRKVPSMDRIRSLLPDSTAEPKHDSPAPIPLGATLRGPVPSTPQNATVRQSSDSYPSTYASEEKPVPKATFDLQQLLNVGQTMGGR